MAVSEEQVKKVVYEVLPRYIREHPEVRGFLREILEECSYRRKSEERFEKLLEEIKRLREEGERRWRETQEEIKRLREEGERRWRETQEEIKRLREESERRWEESERRWRETQEEIKRLREESERRWEESDRRWEEVQKEIKRLHRMYDVGVGALGARWGMQAEETFRNAVKGILEESFPVKVERYLAKDEEGKVFGRPDQVELDLIIRDGEVIAGEIKSSMSKADVYLFDRKVKFFEEKEGKKVKRKLIISPMVEREARKVAEELGIEVYTYPDYINDL